MKPPHCLGLPLAALACGCCANAASAEHRDRRGSEVTHCESTNSDCRSRTVR
jgi:hypothetical protein